MSAYLAGPRLGNRATVDLHARCARLLAYATRMESEANRLITAMNALYARAARRGGGDMARKISLGDPTALFPSRMAKAPRHAKRMLALLDQAVQAELAPRLPEIGRLERKLARVNQARQEAITQMHAISARLGARY